jgi:hypothetical protein
MGRLATSQDSVDQTIFRFLKSMNIREISFKDYKYLRSGAIAEEINRHLTGKGVTGQEERLKIYLEAARQDNRVEQGGRYILPGVPQEVLEPLNAHEKSEINARNFREYMNVREKVGVDIARCFVSVMRDDTHLEFWKDLSTASMLVDTIADFWKDRMAGLIRNVRYSDFPVLFLKTAKYCARTMRKLGLRGTCRYLLSPGLATLKGGFENGAKRHEMHCVFPADGTNAPEIVKNIPQSA